MQRTITIVVGLCIVTGFVAGYSRTVFGEPAQVKAETGDAKEILEKANGSALGFYIPHQEFVKK